MPHVTNFVPQLAIFSSLNRNLASVTSYPSVSPSNPTVGPKTHSVVSETCFFELPTLKIGAAIDQVAMSALGSGRACSPRRSPPTVHCSSQCPPIVRTANVLCARSLPYPWSSLPLRSELGLWTRGLYRARRAYRSVVSITSYVLIVGPVRPAPRWTHVGPEV